MKPRSTKGTLGKIGECAFCEKEFTIGNPSYRFRRKYCSERCIKSRWRRDNLDQHNAQSRDWRKRNPEYYPKYFAKKRGRTKPINHIMKGKSAVAKGKILENWVAERLRNSGLDHNARRTFGSGGGQEKGDIWNALDLNIECKNTKTFSMSSYWRQVQRDSSLAENTPVIVWHPPNTPLDSSVVIINWSYFEELLLGQKGGAPIEEHPKLKYPLMRLKQAASEVLKNLPKEYE